MSIHWGGRGAGHISRWSASTTGVPSLVLDFLTTTSLDSRVTFTRASTATFVGSNGLIQTAAINAPRFDYTPVTLAAKGLLIEEQRTNLLTYSDQFDNSAWSKATGTITANSLVSPDGTTNADTYTQNTGTTGELIRSPGYTVVANADTTLSGFFKPVNGTPGVSLYMTSGGNGFRVIVNLSTGATILAGAIGTGTFVSSSITAFGNGWYRITVTGKLATGATSGQWRMAMTDLTGNNLVGDGSKGIGLYGAQSEQASFPTSYIPTVASTVTRSADVATMTGTNFSSWYNQSAGTFVVAVQAAPNATVTAGQNSLYVSDATGTNNINMRRTTSSFGASGFTTAGVVVADIQPSAVIGASAIYKTSAAFELNNINGATNSVLGIDDTSATIPVVDRLFIGSNIGGGGHTNGHIRQISFYNTRLLNSQLQTLTT